MDITEKERPSDLPPAYSTIVNQPIMPHPPYQPGIYFWYIFLRIWLIQLWSVFFLKLIFFRIYRKYYILSKCSTGWFCSIFLWNNYPATTTTGNNNNYNSSTRCNESWWMPSLSYWNVGRSIYWLWSLLCNFSISTWYYILFTY